MVIKFRANEPYCWIRAFVCIFTFFKIDFKILDFTFFFVSSLGPFFKIIFEKKKAKTDLTNVFSIAIFKKTENKHKKSKTKWLSKRP